MTGDELNAAAAQLERAFKTSGLVVERAEMSAGNVSRWVSVDAHQVIGRWLQQGWRIRAATEEDVEAGPTVSSVLRLYRGDKGERPT